MILRTWKFGGRKMVKVLSRDVTASGLVVLSTVCVEDNEAFILMGAGDAAVDQIRVIEFTWCKTYGGYWRVLAETETEVSR